MADYVAIHRTNGKKFLVRRADSAGHARQLFDENVIGESGSEYELLSLNAGSVAPIPELEASPANEAGSATPEPESPLPETDNPFSGSPAG